MLLKPNMNWIQNQEIALPTVMANTYVFDDFFQIDFSVEEPLNCFRAEIMDNFCHSWEDSCVEIFLLNPTNNTEYYNFEITSRGYIYAAVGANRENRTLLKKEDLNKIERTKQIASVIGEFICWGMSIKIHSTLFKINSFNNYKLIGNLYKCADKAKTPHYLSAFEVKTEHPDFHRPEFFQEL